MTILFRSFGMFEGQSKGQLFAKEAIKWTPEGFFAWISDRSQRPGMVRLRENKMYAHEVAAKLIDEKRRELKDGTSGNNVLSLLG